MGLTLHNLAIKKRGTGYTLAEMKSLCRIDSVSQCWNWRRSLNTHGYGQARHLNGTYAAHRLAFILKYPQKIISKKLICHHCDNRACINPKHLYVGTPLSNMQDMIKRGRQNFPGGAKGEKHKDAKLTIALVRSIRKSSLPHKQLARIVGVDNKTIRDVRARRTWKHVK